VNIRVRYRGFLAVALAAGTLSSCNGPSRLQRILTFETDNIYAPPGWERSPKDTIFLDREVVHGGETSVRIERNPDSAGDASTLTREHPLDVAGRRIELRGWLRTEAVDGEVGLWIGQRNSYQALQWGVMANGGLSGTNDWGYHVVELPVHERAESLQFGVHFNGTGTAWVDDLDLRVDGELIELAPARKYESILDTDTQFALGSGIDLVTLSATQLESLVVLGKVWGFLKYHHRRVAAGELQWDFELFRVMPSVLAAKDGSERNAAMLGWVERVGPVPRCQECATVPASSDVHLHARIEWIRDEGLLGPGLSRALQHIHRNRPVGAQFWIGQVTGHAQGFETPEFSREPAYRHLVDVDVVIGYSRRFGCGTSSSTGFRTAI
jgi:hypothetical protein